MRTLLKLILLLILPVNFLFSAEVLWNNRLEGGSATRPLQATGQMLITDGNFSTIGSFVDARQHAYVRLGLAEKSALKYINGLMGAVVNVTITPYNAASIAQAPITTNLSIEYSSNGTAGVTLDADDYRLNGGIYKFKVYVNSITLSVNGTVVPGMAVPNMLYLEAGIFAERYHNFSGTVPVSSLVANMVSYNATTGAEAVSPGAVQTLPNTDDIELAWNYVVGAEYYDVEWTWVDNYPAGGLTATPLFPSQITLSENEFRRNSTRIRTSSQSYRIPQLFAKGYLIYRVRPVGRWATDVTKDKFGPWSGSAGAKTYVSNWSNVLLIAFAHEGEKNWKYQASYAEEGKKKEIMQYFDGSLRGRQIVTRINSDHRSVVGETIYDNQGRAVIQVLPAPQANPAIRYYANFNMKNDMTKPYSHQDFDWESNGTCNSVAANTMGTGSGAGKYYSSAAHITDQDWQQYVPESSGYPFSQIEYTPDNTGRIRNQSGVGASHQLGTTHETYYYYLQPSQNELDRLFGYKVGYNLRYKKNMTVDANGQVNITYLDAQNRVIASSLAGENPSALDGLDSKEITALHQKVTTDLLNKLNQENPDHALDNNTPFTTGRFGMLNDGLKMGTQLGVVENGTVYDFKYTARFGSYTEDCPLGDGVNFGYVYDLKLSLLDNCGAPVFSETILALDASQFEAVSQKFERNHLNKILNKGSYTLYKEITVNEAALNAYKADYLNKSINECILSASDFAPELATDCYDTDCQSCYDELGTFSQFQNSYAGSGLTTQQLQAMFNKELAECDELCAPISLCDIYYGLMTTDVSPGGQYGSLTGGDLLSVYNTSNNLSGHWKSSGIVYQDELGNPAMISAFYNSNGSYTLEDNGAGTPVMITPNQLTNVSDFVTALQPSWLDALVKFHPEYKLYGYATEICTKQDPAGTQLSSDAYDVVLGQINTYAQAQSNLLGIDFTTAADKIKTSDPYFVLNYTVHNIGAGYQALKNNLLTEALNTNFKGTGMSLLKFAVKTAIHGNNYTIGTPVQNSWSDCVSAFSPAQLDAIWTVYKANYLSFKGQVNQLFMDYYGFTQSYPGTSGFKMFNGYIGSTGQLFGAAGAFSHTCPGETQSLYAGTVISNLFNLWGSGLINWPIAFISSEYDSKTIRFSRIDNLYDAGLCGQEIIAATTEQADYALWESTGLCPLTIDVEHLLDAMGKRNLLTTTTSMALIPELVPDLFNAIRGSYPVSGSTMSVAGSVDGSGNLVLSFTGTPTCTITLPRLSVALPWTTYGASGWKIYKISHSYPVSGTSYSILVKAGLTEATAQEYVITYTTSCLGLNDCQAVYSGNNSLNQNCDKEQKFEATVLDMLQRLRAAGQLNGTNVQLNSLAGFNYNLTMQTYFGSNATWTGSTATITGSSVTYSLGITIPVTTPQVQYVSVNLIGGVLHFSYVNSISGTFVTQSGTPAYVVSGRLRTFPLNCPCADKDALISMESLFSTMLGTSTITNGTTSTSGFSSLAPLMQPGAAIYNFENSNLNNQGAGRGISFTLAADSPYLVSLKTNIEDNVNIEKVINVRFPYRKSAPEIFECELLLSDGRIIYSAGGKFPSLRIPEPCPPCVAPAQQPISCNTAYINYAQAMNTKFATGLSSEDLNIFNADYLVSEADFCARGYAYISTAYISYINHAGVSNLFDPEYISISEFGSTPLGYSSAFLSPAVNTYFTYLSANPNAYLNWNNYINQVYFPAHPEICPAKIPQVYPPDVTLEMDPCLLTNNILTVNAQTQYNIYLDQMGAAFTQAYVEGAMASLVETFTEAHTSKEYHHTLHYYDRAGNLIQTVPPKGVKRYLYDATGAPVGGAPTPEQINTARVSSSNLTGEGTTTLPSPAHELKTIYRYNSLNQLVYQKTPDGGESLFAYDKLGRLIVSQNAKQVLLRAFSYTIYDGLGRTIEVGEFVTQSNSYKINDLGRLVNFSSGAEITISNVNWVSGLTASLTRREVTRSIYDGLAGITTPLASGSMSIKDLFGTGYGSKNTRNRITGVIYQNVYSANLNTYDNANFYDYDVHGNVKHLIQINRNVNLIALNQHIKHFEYNYDLISDNVKELQYQKGFPDFFVHRYQYDSDNRITDVETSNDGVYFEKDAKYFYYAHGPLARTETGQKKVQALDYAYTIQGWLKTVNGEKLDPNTAMGNEGKTTTPNKMIARDAFGFSLNYYQGDYTSANTQMLNHSMANTNMSSNLYNGNIRAMITSISRNDESAMTPHKTCYTYDQLQRIRSMNGYDATSDIVSGYGSTYTYDPNGNLKTLSRVGKNTAGTSVLLDNLSYNYKNLSGIEINQLDNVNDLQGVVIPGVDLGAQGANNYVYDAIGQLYSDASEKIGEIKWTVTGKVKEVIYNGTLLGKKIVFDYNTVGQRIAKHVTAINGDVTSTFYVLDAQGNPLSTYIRQKNASVYKLYLEERNIYGSSRIGIETSHLEMNLQGAMPDISQRYPFNALAIGPGAGQWTFDESPATSHQVLDANGDGVMDLKVYNTIYAPMAILGLNLIAGDQYTIAYDVLSTTSPLSVTLHFSGGSIPVTSSNFTFTASGTGSAWLTFTFGTSVTGNFVLGNLRISGPGNVYGNGVILQKKSPNVIGDKRYELANHLGNVLNVVTDRKLPIVQGTTAYQNNFSINYNPFAATGTIALSLENGRLKATSAGLWNNIYMTMSTVSGRVYRLWFDMDLSGGGNMTAFARNTTTSANLTVVTVSADGRRYIEFTATSTTTMIAFENPVAGPRTFYVDDILVEDLNTASLATVGSYTADVVSYSDYYPFGMQMPGRNGNDVGSYRYGFQGQEKDDELKGEGNSLNYTFRMHDPRIGRFFAVDPLTSQYPHYSPYSFSGNVVIHNIELEGLENIHYLEKKDDGTWGAAKIDGKDWIEVNNDLDENVNCYLYRWPHGSGTMKSVYKSHEQGGKDRWEYNGGIAPYELIRAHYDHDKGPSRDFNSRTGLSWWQDGGMEGGAEAGGYHIPTEREKRIAGNTIIIAGGIITMIATGGASAPVIIAGITSGSMAVAGGTAKMVLDIKGDYGMSDKVPTGYLNATVGATAEYYLGNDKKNIQKIKGTLSIVEGAATFTPYAIPKTMTDMVSKTMTITNIAIDSDVKSLTK